MFGKAKVTQSMIDAVNKILGEQPVEEKEQVLNETSSIKEPTSTGMKVYGGSYGNSAKAKQDQTKSSIDDIKGPSKKDIEKDESDAIEKQSKDNLTKSMKAMGKNDRQIKYIHKKTDDVIKKAAGEKVKKEEVEVQEELKGNQDKIDANHNGKIDGQDFAILRGKKKVKEGREFAEKLLASINEKKDVVMPEDTSTPAKNQDIADKSYLKDKPGSVKSDLKNLGRFLTGKKETNEEVELDEQINEVLSKDASAGECIDDFVHSDNPKFAGKSKAERKKMALGAYYGHHKEESDITTDTLAGRTEGGKSDDYKKYKVKLKGDIESKAPEAEKPEMTAARDSIKTEATIAGTPGWEKIKDADQKGNIKDKSGATHTPMSRAKDLARQAFKKIKNETMMGKISN